MSKKQLFKITSEMYIESETEDEAYDFWTTLTGTRFFVGYNEKIDVVAVQLHNKQVRIIKSCLD